MDYSKLLKNHEVVNNLAIELAAIAHAMEKGQKVGRNNLIYAIQQCDTVKKILEELPK